MLVVEPLRGEDLGQVAEVAYRSLQEQYGPSWLLHNLESPDCTCMVARESTNRAVVGFAVARKGGYPEGELLALAVDGQHRGEGIGTALLRSVHDQMARRGAFRLALEVRADDSAAQGFYQRNGYCPEGLHGHAYSDGADAVLMAKPLR